MSSTTTDPSLQCMEVLQQAIPALLATSDFVENLESSLQSISTTFAFDFVFFLINDPPENRAGALVGLLAMEKSGAGRREFLERKIDSELLTLKSEVTERLSGSETVNGTYSRLFANTALAWAPHTTDEFTLIPLFCGQTFRGVLGLGSKGKLRDLSEPQQISLDTYTKTLANWLERYEVFRTVRRERDQLRDIINFGAPLAVKEATLRSNREHSITDAQLLNRKITTTIPDQIFIIDLHDYSNLFSNRSTFLGYDLDSIDNPFEFFQKLIHPYDIGPAFEHFFEKLMAANDEDIIESEYRMYTKAGKLTWFNERVKVFKRDNDGQVWQYLNVLQDITVKKEAEFAKKESDMLFHSLYEKNPLGVLIGDTIGNILRCNDRFAEMLDLTEEELIGKNFKAIIHPDDYLEVLTTIRRKVAAQKTIMFLETRYLSKHGRVIWANLHLSLLYTEEGKLRLAIGMVEDITERRKIYQALEKNENFQKAILTTLPDLKFRISKEGFYLDYYPSPNDGEDLLARPEEFLGRKLEDIIPGYIAAAVRKNIEQALQTGELREFEYVLPINGKLNHYEIRISAINQEEVIAVIRNVSERNWAQIELRNKIRELDEKNKQLKDYIDSNMQLENFAYIASHDLREPLRTMGTFAELLQKRYGDRLDETAHTYIDFVVKSARDMNNLIEDLLTYSRVETQENPKTEIALPALLQEVIGGLKETIQENEAVIEWNNLPDQVTANANRLKQLFQNLIANAIKFRKPELPPIVYIDCSDTGKCWQFVIRDNGIGIAPEFFSKIFLLFKKLHSRQDVQGTGLGLAICKKVVEQMGGEIWVESAVGEGSCFFFTIQKSV